MTAREAFLQRVREAVAEGNRMHHSLDLRQTAGVGYQGAGPDPVARFVEEWGKAGGHCHLVDSEAQAVQKVLELVQGTKSSRILLSRRGALERLDLTTALNAIGAKTWVDPWAEVTRDDPASIKAEMFAADVGVTGVDWLIAETGTIVLTTREGQPRSASLLPPVHIAVAHRDQILPDLFDLFPALRAASAKGRAGLPACVTLITGPSKTGDIELRLVTGVHGPGEVHVVLLTR